jgi:hypothetical protein
MQRIAIVGGARRIRAPLARQLGSVLDLPVLSIADLPRHARDAAVLGVWHDQSRWVIDGWGPWRTVLRRLELADTVVFVDLPFARLGSFVRRARLVARFRRPDMISRVLHLRTNYDLREFRQALSRCEPNEGTRR